MILLTKKALQKICKAFSREDRIRTCDHLVPNQVRYRPALLPEVCLNLFAVREGFEPSVQFNPYGSLANYWFEPLTHLTFVRFPFRKGLQK